MSVGLPTRRCMVCRRDLLKGFYARKTDPICIECTQKVRAQRQLLRDKYRRIALELRALERKEAQEQEHVA